MYCKILKFTLVTDFSITDTTLSVRIKVFVRKRLFDFNPSVRGISGPRAVTMWAYCEIFRAREMA